MKMIKNALSPEESSHWNNEIQPFLQAHLATWLEGDSELATMVRRVFLPPLRLVWNWNVRSWIQDDW